MVQATSLTSTDLATILGLNAATFISSGLCVNGNVTSVPFRVRADCAEFTSGSTHQAIQCSNTLAILESLSGKANEIAKADLTLKFKSTDGFTPPCAVVSSVALSDASLVGEYVLHSMTVNGVAIPELQGVDISTGLKVTEQRGTGPFVTAHYITENLPTIMVTTENVAYAAAVLNAATLGSGVVIYFAKRKSAGIIEDVADLVHIAVTASGGFGQAETIGGDARATASNTVKFNPLSLSAAVGVAIS
jgi:hypothetical protein